MTSLVLTLSIGNCGLMLNDARLHLVLFPALAGAVLGFSFLGDAMRGQLNPLTRLELGL